MLCGICSRAEATIHVLDHPPIESHYCLACYDRKFLHPTSDRIAIDESTHPPTPPPFPLARFTIRDLMIVALIFGVTNGALAIFVRMGQAGASPYQVRQWTDVALVAGNSLLAILLVAGLTFEWLRRIRLQRMTGAPPALREGASPLAHAFHGSLLAWPYAFLLLIGMARPPLDLLAYRVGGRFALALLPLALPLILIVGWLLLYLGLVASTRRR